MYDALFKKHPEHKPLFGSEEKDEEGRDKQVPQELTRFCTMSTDMAFFSGYDSRS